MKYILISLLIFFSSCYTPINSSLKSYHKSGKVYIKLNILPKNVSSSVKLKQAVIREFITHGLEVVEDSSENIKKYYGYEVGFEDIRGFGIKYVDGVVSTESINVTVYIKDIKSGKKYIDSLTITAKNNNKTINGINSSINDILPLIVTSIFNKMIASQQL